MQSSLNQISLLINNKFNCNQQDSSKTRMDKSQRKMYIYLKLSFQNSQGHLKVPVHNDRITVNYGRAANLNIFPFFCFEQQRGADRCVKAFQSNALLK